MKNILILALTLSSVPAFACKMSEANLDAYRISEAAKYFVKNVETPARLRITGVRLSGEGSVVVNAKLNEQCLAATYSVAPQADCAPQVNLVTLDGQCE